MDFLKSLAGMFTSSVLRLVVTVGTLVAVYFFILKPVLDTTSETVDKFSQAHNQSLQLGEQQLAQAEQQVQQAIRQANAPRRQAPGQVRITRTLTGLTPRQARALTRCLKRTAARANGIDRCFNRFSRK